MKVKFQCYSEEFETNGGFKQCYLSYEIMNEVGLDKKMHKFAYH